MASLLVKNIGTFDTGKLETPLRRADSIFIKDGVAQAIGSGLSQAADQVVDANGVTAIPGLIDSHSHPSIGEYTAFPRRARRMWVRRRRMP
jgi:enamidase